MPDRVPVFPSQRRVAYAPTPLSSHPEEAMDDLLQMQTAEARRAIQHTVDPLLVTELQHVLLHAEILGKEHGAKLLDLREQVLGQRLTNTRRLSIIAAGTSARDRGEKEQLDNEESIGFDSMTPAEQARRLHARRLWDFCGVRGQIEFIAFPKSADQAEMQLIEMLSLRKQALFHDLGVPLRDGAIEYQPGVPVDSRGFDEVPNWLAKIGRDLAAIRAGQFGVDTLGDKPLAVSCLHELRFYGHGHAGSGGSEAGFKFADKVLSTSDLRSPLRVSAFAAVRATIAPGASILLEGCETGRGTAGKAFLKALAELFFGSFKWGFVRASTQPIIMSPYLREGPLPGSPVTYQWPDDF